MELVKINASEYGLEESKAQEIEAQFKPMLAKMSELEKEYNKVIKLEINGETCAKAKELRLRYVKVRTGTDEIHKKQKAFYLSGGRFCDGWKNAQKFASQSCEDTLMAIEKHFENIENERIEKLQIERQSEVMKYESEMIVPTLGIMDDDVWINYINGVKLNHEQKIAAEKKVEEERIEQERLRKLKLERDNELRLYWKFIPGNHPDFESLSDSEWSDFLQEMKNAKESYDKEQEEIRKEKERLEKAAIKKQKEYEAKLKSEREAREKAEKIEREKREKLQAELNAKAEAEREEKQRLLDEEQKRIKAEKAAQLAPDKDKLINLSQRIMSIDMPVLKAKEANDIMLNVVDMLSKIDSYIKEKVENL